jgi:hypothetical protein
MGKRRVLLQGMEGIKMFVWDMKGIIFRGEIGIQAHVRRAGEQVMIYFLTIRVLH